MIKTTQKLLYKVYGGKLFMDMNVWSTLEPHAEKFKFENIPVDPNVTGLVLPLEIGGKIASGNWMTTELKRLEPIETLTKSQLADLGNRFGWHCSSTMGKGQLLNGVRRAARLENNKKPSVKGNILKEVFKSWPRLYHQREFERPYLTKRIQVLELGPFEVLLGGLERPLVTNIQFSSEMPLTKDGAPDIRIGVDVARRSHYLLPELASKGLLGSLYGVDDLDLSRVAPYGATPSASPGKVRHGTTRLYHDDKVRPHWAVINGDVKSHPRTPLSIKPTPLIERQWAERKEDYTGEGAAPTTTPTSDSASKKSKKKWEGWNM